MAEDQKYKDAADIAEKLNAPKRISQFERQRQEAESKRLRDEAERRKVLSEFKDDFGEDDDHDPISQIAGGRNAPSGPRGAGLSFGGTTGPRHFPTPAGPRRAGPGTLGEPPSLKRKREQEELEDMRRRNRDQYDRPSLPGRSGFGQNDSRRDGLRLDDEDDEEERMMRKTPEPTVRKPTMLLTSLPWDTQEDVIRSLMPTSLKVEDVNLIYPSGHRTNPERTISALVTATADTPISDVDNAVTGLQKRYLGVGCYLNISRHISSSGLGPSINNLGQGSDSQPFGAKHVFIPPPPSVSLARAPPPGSFSNVAPPNSYLPTGPTQTHGFTGPPQVSVLPPSDIKQLKIIHGTLEKIVEYGIEFESLLMSRPEVQQSESWAWLFDSTSQAGVYYRWLLWKYFSEAGDNVNEGNDLFDTGPVWMPPSDQLKYEHIIEFEDIAEDEEYVSSDDDSDEENPQREYNKGKAPPPVEDDTESGQARYLNPYRKAKLTHLLARLPDSISMLRMGDVARVTNFVVNTAGQGAEEIVDMLLSNIEHPYNFCVSYGEDEDRDMQRAIAFSEEVDGTRRDNSNSKLIGLYLVSDALRVSSISGVRDAWKYRTLFEHALTARKTFEHLGRIEKDLQWGRIKSEQWKRKVGIILALWEEWNTFPVEVAETFKKGFNEPPLTTEERKAKQEDEAREREERERKRWKSAEVKGEEDEAAAAAAVTAAKVKQDENDTKQKTIAEKIADLKRKVDKGKAKHDSATTAEGLHHAQADGSAPPSSIKQEQQQQQQQQQRPMKRARPTAADLITTNVVEPIPQVQVQPPAPEPAPAAVKPGGFGFSMSLGGGGSAPQQAVKRSDDKAVEAKPAEDMFADSDGEQ